METDKWAEYIDDNTRRKTDEFNLPKPKNPSDFELVEAVKEILHNTRFLDSSHILVFADGGNVTLSGEVKSSPEKNAAGSLTQSVHGVGLINNNITVRDEKIAS